MALAHFVGGGADDGAVVQAGMRSIRQNALESVLAELRPRDVDQVLGIVVVVVVVVVHVVVVVSSPPAAGAATVEGPPELQAASGVRGHRAPQLHCLLELGRHYGHSGAARIGARRHRCEKALWS